MLYKANGFMCQGAMLCEGPLPPPLGHTAGADIAARGSSLSSSSSLPRLLQGRAYHNCSFTFVPPQKKYICIYKYIYIYTYLYIHTYREREASSLERDYVNFIRSGTYAKIFSGKVPSMAGTKKGSSTISNSTNPKVEESWYMTGQCKIYSIIHSLKGKVSNALKKHLRLLRPNIKAQFRNAFVQLINRNDTLELSAVWLNTSRIYWSHLHTVAAWYIVNM